MFEEQAFFEKEKSYRQKVMEAFVEYGKLKCIYQTIRYSNRLLTNGREYKGQRSYFYKGNFG